MSFNSRSIFARTGLSVAVAMTMMSSVALADEVYELGEIVVTAARTAQTVDETLAPVTVINRKQIERSQATSVTELLNQAPGVQITSSGGPGSKSGVYIRGTKTAQSLVLIDGLKVNTASGGESPLEYIDPEQIERIEIVRGPRASLYGSDAVGGVINIITRKGSGAPKLTVKAGGGSRNTGEYGLNLGGEVDHTQFSFGARLFETQGYDRTLNQSGTDSDDDAFRNKSLSGSVVKHLDNGVSLGVNAIYTEGKAEFDNNDDYMGYPTALFKETVVNTHVSADVNDIWSTRFEMGFVRDERNNVDGEYPNHTINKRYAAAWQNDILWAEDQLLITGLDYANDTADKVNGSAYALTDRYNVGVFAMNQTLLTNSDLQISGRVDRNEIYGNHTTGGISWGTNLPADTRLIASYSTAFRAPTFMDLGYESNPNLDDVNPETSKNAELEFRARLGNGLSWSVNLYQNDMKDMLEYYEGRTQNIAQARIRGIEFVAQTQVYGWDVNGNLSFLDPENLSGSNAGKKLYRRATQLFSMNMDQDFGRWTLGGTFRAQGSSWNDVGNTDRVPGFGTIDLRASVSLAPELKTQFKIINLMDKQYTTTKGYVDEPRGVFATFVWSPEL